MGQTDTNSSFAAVGRSIAVLNAALGSQIMRNRQ